jgi:hypothetical protein
LFSFATYFQNFVSDVLSVSDKLVLVVDIVVDDDHGSFGVLEVVLLRAMADQRNAQPLDEADDLFVGGGLFAHRVGLVLVRRPEDLRHEDGNRLERNLD